MRFVIAVAIMMLMIASSGAAMAQAPSPEDRIEAALSRARQAGIPVSLLESKIAEGKAKGVSMERIAEAVARRQAGLERASQALQGRPNIGAADLSVAADAMESGVSAAVLQAVADAAPRERRVVAIAALTQLVQLGHVPQEALDRVREALKRGPEALANLPAQAAAAAGRRGGPPEVPAPAGGPGRGGAPAGPPAAVPAPGDSPQPARPGGPPANPGPPTTPGAGRGRS